MRYLPLGAEASLGRDTKGHRRRRGIASLSWIASADVSVIGGFYRSRRFWPAVYRSIIAFAISELLSQGPRHCPA